MQTLNKPSFQKLIFFLFTLVFISTFSKAQDFIEHLDQNEIIPPYLQANKVLKKTTYSFTTKGDSTFVDSVKYQYDDRGNMVSLETFNIDYIIKKNQLRKSTTLFEYTNANKLGKEAHYRTNEKDPLGRNQLTYEFQYDSLGKQVYTVFYNKDTSSLKIFRKIYDNKGKLSDTYLRINNNKEVLHNKVTYDNENRMSELQTYDDKGQNPYYYTFEYNKRENTRTTFRFYKNEKQFSEKILYSTTGQPLSITTVNKGYASDITDANSKIQKFVYNNDGTLSVIITYVDRKVVSINKIFYVK